MADSLAKVFHTKQRIEREELRSTAYMALVEAARTYDPARRVNFATFARHRIRGALRGYLKNVISESWRTASETRPLVRQLAPGSERYVRVSRLSEERPVGAEIESIEDVEALLGRLPKQHALACRLIYLSGKSQDEVAAMLGCSRSQLCRLHQDSLAWLIDEYNASRADGREPEERK
jgi:RNA polymerase sigma factor (sigma-70 family)